MTVVASNCAKYMYTECYFLLKTARGARAQCNGLYKIVKCFTRSLAITDTANAWYRHLEFVYMVSYLHFCLPTFLVAYFFSNRMFCVCDCMDLSQLAFVKNFILFSKGRNLLMAFEFFY